MPWLPVTLRTPKLSSATISKVTNEKVDFEKVLSDSELTRLGLKLGEVKDYA